MKILDGRIASKHILNDINIKIKEISPLFRNPRISIILIGNNPASETYVNSKKKLSTSVGIQCDVFRYDDSVLEEDIIKKIKDINEDESYDGVMVQLPIPKHININNIINEIDPNKDIDGFHPLNFGKFSIGQDGFKPATPYGIIKLLEFYNIETKGKHCVVIGRSNIVGKPISIMLGNDFSIGNCTVTHTHIETPKELLYQQCRMADIIIVAVGIPNFITKDMVKNGVIIVDVGINNINGKLVGDVDYKSVSPLCEWITPVPGGVGPMTISTLLLNTYKSYKKKFNKYESKV